MELNNTKDGDKDLQFDIAQFKRKALNIDSLTKLQKETLTTKPDARRIGGLFTLFLTFLNFTFLIFYIFDFLHF